MTKLLALLVSFKPSICPLLPTCVLKGMGKDNSTRPFQIKYIVRENLHTQHINSTFVLSFSHAIKSLIYHSVQEPAQVYLTARLSPYSWHRKLSIVLVRLRQSFVYKL